MKPAAQVDILALGEGDTARLRALARLISGGEEPPSEGYLERMLYDAGFIALVAVAQGQVVGGLAAYVLRGYAREGCEVHLSGLAVAEDWRRRGVATAMIRRLQAMAGDRGAQGIVALAGAGAEAAALFARLGEAAPVLRFEIGAT